MDNQTFPVEVTSDMPISQLRVLIKVRRRRALLHDVAGGRAGRGEQGRWRGEQGRGAWHWHVRAGSAGWGAPAGLGARPPPTPAAPRRSRVQEKTGVPEPKQRLIFRGKMFKSTDLISTHKLCDGHTIHLVARPDGVPASPQSPPQDDNVPLGTALNRAAVRRPGPLARPCLPLFLLPLFLLPLFLLVVRVAPCFPVTWAARLTSPAPVVARSRRHRGD